MENNIKYFLLILTLIRFKYFFNAGHGPFSIKIFFKSIILLNVNHIQINYDNTPNSCLCSFKIVLNSVRIHFKLFSQKIIKPKATKKDSKLLKWLKKNLI